MADLDQATVSTASETQPILLSIGDTQHCRNGEIMPKPRIRFRLPLISERGAILMIVWNLFFATSLFSYNPPETKEIFAGVLFFLYPIVGWLVDSKLGKYKVLQAALYALLVSIVLDNLSVFVFDQNMILAWSAAVVRMLAGVCYISCIVPFVMDQMVGASGEELSFTIYWLIWGTILGFFVHTAIPITGNTSQTQSFIRLSIASPSFLTAYILFQYFSHLLNTKPQLSNPIKLIAQVLNYARKHKYPERRSALTYWEEDYPSRLDLGKQKYGGPFTFEHVENVKTICRLLPLIASISAATIGTFVVFRQIVKDSDSVLDQITFEIIVDEVYALSLAATLVALPIYHFIIYPLFYNCIPTIIRRIGFGIFLACIYCIVNVVVQFPSISDVTNSSNVTCIFDPAFKATSHSILIIFVIHGCFYMLPIAILAYFPLELIIAQTPHEIKGLVLCISIELFYFTAIVSEGILTIFFYVPFNVYPHCGFYYYIFVFIITTIAFFAYLYFARKYKLRVRDDIVPVHRLAEEYFEKEEKLRRAYWKDIGFEESGESE